MTIQANSNVNLTGGTFTFNAGLTIGGEGNMVQNGANVTVQGAVTCGAAYELRAGTLEGAGTLLITNRLTWTGGTMDGTGVTEIAVGKTMLIDANVTCITRTIRNRGAATLNTARRLTLDSCVFDNYGNLFLVGTARIDRALNPVPSNLLNRSTGVIKKTQTGNAQVRCEVTSQGSVIVDAGDLTFNNHGTYSGSFTVNAGATITYSNQVAVAAAIHNFQVGSTFTGVGQVIFGGTNVTMSIAGGHSLRMDQFLFTEGGTIDGGTIGARVFEWNIGVIKDCVVDVISGDRLLIGAEGNCNLDNSWILNGGTIEWTDNNIVMQNASEIDISVKMKILGTGTIISGNAERINILSGGLLQKVAGDLTVLEPLVTNTGGTLDAGGRLITLTRDYDSIGGTTYVGANGHLQTFGTYVQQGESAVVEVFGGIFQAVSCEIHAGEFRLGAGTANATMNLLGGLLVGRGTINGNVTNSARIRVFSDGVPGTLDIYGSYTQSAAGVLEIHATQDAVDRLLVSNDVNLNGTVEIS